MKTRPSLGTWTTAGSVNFVDLTGKLWLGLMLILAAFAASAEQATARRCLTFSELGTTALIDYNDPSTKASVASIESHHFNEKVQTLTGGQTSYEPASDLSFVLRYIPNHYQALDLMGRWQSKNGVPAESRVEPAECYFDRAIAFRPDDPLLQILYGVYLHQKKQLEEAERHYKMAEQLGADSAEFHYNFGLLMVDMGNIERAQTYAVKAYGLGYPLPGLKNKLDRLKGK